ncbi:hypothetical protein FA13DRAFT_718729 [Coprinellus micaceus]|uniref:Uncharacterized protein n=1 Tax=Coprinellus micaceus TaxID=71717 RepID=A0A4Y7TWT9_COPMI|nr:hypothetical protein FA13DRAFT_718729 [Coprinellus micaceus]
MFSNIEVLESIHLLTDPDTGLVFLRGYPVIVVDAPQWRFRSRSAAGALIFDPFSNLN